MSESLIATNGQHGRSSLPNRRTQRHASAKANPRQHTGRPDTLRPARRHLVRPTRAVPCRSHPHACLGTGGPAARRCSATIDRWSTPPGDASPTGSTLPLAICAEVPTPGTDPLRLYPSWMRTTANGPDRTRLYPYAQPAGGHPSAHSRQCPTADYSRHRPRPSG